MQLAYDNIAISGGIAVGTTTLFNNLKPYLEPYGFKFKSIGQFVREHTKENVFPVATLVSDDFDREIERKVRETFKREKQWVIESWLAGFLAKDLKKTLKILLTCSNEALRIDRIVNRDGIPVKEAKKLIKKREEENFKKWRRLYGDHDFLSPDYYHLCIDTYSSGQLETVGKVLDALGYKQP